jgi:hypothetical protein
MLDAYPDEEGGLKEASDPTSCSLDQRQTGIPLSRCGACTLNWTDFAPRENENT